MSFLLKIWAWLKSSPRKNGKKWHPDLNPIDIQKISRELNLKVEAHRLGQAGVPAESSEKFSGPEAAVVFKIEEVRLNYMNWAGLRLASVDEELSRKDITKDINQASRADEEFERLAGAAITAKELILRDLRDLARARKDEFDLFKRQNKLDRLPLVPSSVEKAVIVILAVVMIAVEALLNMSFFAKGLSTGLLGGFFEAAIAAMVNVVGCFMSGAFFVRWTWHVRIMPKLFGLASCGLTLGFIGLMALGIAHYRDSLVMSAENAMGLALRTLLASPLSLNELSSWLLCFVSIGFGIGAVCDGFKYDDPYPGYGKKYSLADEAIQDYNAEIQDLHGYLQELKKETLDRIEDVAKSSEASVAVQDNIIGTKRRSVQEFAVALHSAETALHALLQEFRGENHIARGEKPVPAYFNTWPELRRLETPNFDTATDEANLRTQRQLLSTFLGDVENIRARIQTAFTTRFNSLQTLHANFVPIPADARATEVQIPVTLTTPEDQPGATPTQGLIREANDASPR